VQAAAPPGTSAVALALVNSLGKAGGALGPLGIGLLVDAAHSYTPGILLVAAALLGGGLLALGYWGDSQQARYQRLEAADPRASADPRAVELAVGVGRRVSHGAD
jgi:hypothetical protein